MPQDLLILMAIINIQGKGMADFLEFLNIYFILSVIRKIINALYSEGDSCKILHGERLFFGRKL